MRRFPSKPDANQSDLLATLRGLGWEVIGTNMVPNFVDAVGWHPRKGFAIFEFKMPKGTLRQSQKELLARGWPITVIRSADEAIAFTVRRS